ncbi:MAG: putative cobaltochelatase [bacterium]
MSCREKAMYPFTSIIGQEKMKKALILNAVNPYLGGVLIQGEKGTAKSTAVRALAYLLPKIKVVADCPFSCDPDNEAAMCSECRARKARGEVLPSVWRRTRVVNLPVSATEDRVVGTIDLEKAIKKGERSFEPGVLALANRGILYVDEINLLDDHIVDILLDSAAMGINIVEREGISFVHPASFILVGTMNPEEGDLRPQLLDRFGLCVSIEGIADPKLRVEVIKKRAAYEEEPFGFMKEAEAAQETLRQEITAAQNILPEVNISDAMLEMIADISVQMAVDGHRADIVMMKTAKTLAAYYQHREVTEDDVREAAELVLLHRARRAPEEEQQEQKEEQEEQQQEEQQNEPQDKEPEASEAQKNAGNSQPQEKQEEQQQEEQQNENEAGDSDEANGAKETIFAIGKEFKMRRLFLPKDRKQRNKGSGRRSRTKTNLKSGRYVRATINMRNKDLALDATLRAAAPYQMSRDKNGLAFAVHNQDFREKVREKRIGNFIVFLVDASGSMGAQQRMVAAKGAIESFLLDAYQKRDEISLIAFKGERSELLLPPTSSVELAHKLLKEMPTGGKTPLSSGLQMAYELIVRSVKRDPDLYPLLVLISDGKGNVSLGEKKPGEEVQNIAAHFKDEGIRSLVIDVEKKSLITFGLAKKLADLLGGQYYKLEELQADNIVQAVNDVLDL